MYGKYVEINKVNLETRLSIEINFKIVKIAIVKWLEVSNYYF